MVYHTGSVVENDDVHDHGIGGNSETQEPKSDLHKHLTDARGGPICSDPGSIKTEQFKSCISREFF